MIGGRPTRDWPISYDPNGPALQSFLKAVLSPAQELISFEIV
jgi:hypothetical protein